MLSLCLYSAFPVTYIDGRKTWMVNLRKGGDIVHAEADSLREAIDVAVRLYGPSVFEEDR